LSFIIKFSCAVPSPTIYPTLSLDDIARSWIERGDPGPQ